MVLSEVRINKQRYYLNIINKSQVQLSKADLQFGDILRILSLEPTGMVLSELSDKAGLSIPTATKLVNNLIKENLVIKGQFKTNENGRPPSSYYLNPKRFYVIGVEILSKFLHISIWSHTLELIDQSTDRDFSLVNDPSCLHYVIDSIKSLIDKSGVKSENILGVGVGMIETLRSAHTMPTEFFDNRTESIETQLENALNLPVLLDSDTRSIAVAEQVLGIAKGQENAMVVKVSRTLGLGLIIDGKVLSGASGLSGKFRHTQFNKGDLLCYCGKKGCLGTKVGGDALRQSLVESIDSGQSSIYFKKNNYTETDYHKILDASLNGDELSLNLVQEQGIILGEALGNLVNILNPELLVIGGEFAMLGDSFVDAVKLGIRKTGLKENVDDCSVVLSTLGRYLSSKAGASMFLHSYKLLNTDIRTEE